ncbi:MAG TPA: DUF6703 family protein [Intrasporangium sp.]|uniref:DUF6703 family protein n=1 Tax=Intrasporangium sp. TaxID=1925024 RepID=UPI002D76BE5D|nr:DUF6703 family protein [Intrasporangium sp.]HET7399142.1 DUF6703 family protein [Intrasporangium sp.]
MGLSFRSRVEHASVPLVERMHRVPRALAVGVLVVIVGAGVLAPSPWGGVALLLLGAFLGWLLFLTWQRLALPERLLRIAVLLLTLSVAIVRLFPK